MFDDTTRLSLLELAESTIVYGIEHDEPPSVEPGNWETLPGEERATFVTVFVDDELNGCMGRLEATRPLPADVVSNAYRAAFHDPRFSAPTADDLEDLDVEISVLSPLEPVPGDTREEVFDHVEPGRHGVVLVRGQKRGTFLPSVWEKCSTPEDFLAQLKRKAGLPSEGWSPDIEVYRYQVDDFTRETL